MNYKYEIVINYIYDKIINNEIKLNQKIPSERTLSEILNVSRTTVKYAIDKMIKDRVLYQVHGKGTFIRSDNNQSSIIIDKKNPDAFHSNVMSRGLMTHDKVISFKVLYDYETLQHVFPNTNDFYELIRIRYIQDNPSSIEYCYFPFKLFPDANRYDFSKNSLYAYMESKNKNPINFLKSIEVIHNSEISNILQLNSLTPLFYQTYQGSDHTGRLVEYTKSYSSSQNLKFGFEVRKEKKI